ncbi:MAG: hypothetical protein ACRYGF_17165 [Janthinobacterium lividum]
MALHLSQFFTALAGKPVSFSFAGNAPAPKEACMYSLYTAPPEAAPVVMRISLQALALLGASLLGLPEDTALERAAATPTDEPMRDAMHEVLNIASTAIGGDTRLVFQTMFRDKASLPGEAATLLAAPGPNTSFRIAVDGADSGMATLFY